jgi:ATP-dependent DNA ligase
VDENHAAGERINPGGIDRGSERAVPEDMARPLGGRRRAEVTALPNWIKPQLTKLVDQPPEGLEWLHEIKFDGYRMHARLDRGAVRLLTRTGLDWTPKYPTIAVVVASLSARAGLPRRRIVRSPA